MRFLCHSTDNIVTRKKAGESVAGFKEISGIELATGSAVDGASSSLRAIHSACNVLAYAADRIAAGAKGNKSNENGCNGCEETCRHAWKLPLCLRTRGRR